MKIEAFRRQGYQLLHDGIVELARVEANGIRIDVPLLHKTKIDLKKKKAVLREEIENLDIWRFWKRRFGGQASLTSGDQLAHILYKELGHPVKVLTDRGKPSVADEALQNIDEPFIKPLSRFLKYDFCLRTPITGIERELVGDRIHPSFNLHMAKTYRSSSDRPNFQNFPIRDKESAEIVRQLFIASKGYVLSENDFKGIEVGVSACYHKDENFIRYVKGQGDMHRDMAAQIYCLEPSDVSKDARYGAKNKFVFPEFYGDFYVSCAKALWEWIDKGKLTAPGGVPLKEHLKKHGIHKLGACNPDESPESGTFEKHLQEVEDDFWNNRFKDYGQWKRDWYRDYLKRGYFDILTGFRVHGSFRRNQAVNYPVQGAAFHCLLWTLIRVNRLLRKYRMKSMLVGQIHDSLIGDIVEKELRDYLEIVEHTVTVELRKAYDWLIVPLKIEYEICPPNGNWFQKREMKFKQGAFIHPKDPNKFTTDPTVFLKILGN